MASFMPGLSYGAHTGSIAYPRRNRCTVRPKQDMLRTMLELVHPGNLGALPPSPAMLASKGVQMGVATYGEFFEEVWS